MPIKNVYGFTDEGKKVKIGEYLEIYPVGGKIFYIDSSSTATYKFYDSNMVEIVDPVVGSSPTFYERLTEDPNNIEKYYIWDNTNGIRNYEFWGYENIVTGVTSTAIGTGKANTVSILAITDTSSYATYSAFRYLKNANTARLNSCSDWYIPSMEEGKELLPNIRSLVPSASGKFDLITSSEELSTSEYTPTSYYRAASYWSWSLRDYARQKNDSHDSRGCVFIRSF